MVACPKNCRKLSLSDINISKRIMHYYIKYIGYLSLETWRNAYADFPVGVLGHYSMVFQ